MVALIGAATGILKWQKIGPFRFQIAATEQELEQIDADFPDDKPNFIDMDPIVIPLFQDDQLAGNIQLAIKLEIRNKNNYSKIYRLMPKLADAFLSDLYVYIPRYLIRAEQIDITTIKSRLLKLSDKVAGPGVIADVLVHALKDNQSRASSQRK